MRSFWPIGHAVSHLPHNAEYASEAAASPYDQDTLLSGEHADVIM